MSDRDQLVAALMSVPCQHNDWRRDGSTVYELVSVGRHDVNRWSAQVQSAGQPHEHNTAQRKALAEYIKCASPEVVKSLFAEIENLTAELSASTDRLCGALADSADLESRLRREIAGLKAELARYREACAKVCDESANFSSAGLRGCVPVGPGRSSYLNGWSHGAQDAAIQIRALIARPETKEPT